MTVEELRELLADYDAEAPILLEQTAGRSLKPALCLSDGADGENGEYAVTIHCS